MVLLCVGCHARVTRKEIEKSAIRSYKRNLALLNGRYSLFEMRMLESYRDLSIMPTEDGTSEVEISKAYMVTETQRLHLAGLEKDGYIKLVELPTRSKNYAKSFLKKDTSKPHLDGYNEEEKLEITQRMLDLVQGYPQYSVYPTIEGKNLLMIISLVTN